MNEVVVVNEKDEVIGTMPREEAHRTGVPHRIAVVYVINPKGEILIQVRMSGKLDHSSAGHLDPGETYEQAAYRELKEELGIEGVKLIEVGSGRVDEPRFNSVHVFKIFSCAAEPKQLQKDEVKDVYWKDPKTVWEEMENDPNDDIYTRCFKKTLQIYLNFS
jgi:16S rRNA (adenine1518-N6/adenine1519-N6)-dimethyltransferase